jgi:hypothetical protein
VKACLLNLASCGLKLQRHAEVVQYTSEVLTSEPNNVKALYRRGQVLPVHWQPLLRQHLSCKPACSAYSACGWRARAASASTYYTLGLIIRETEGRFWRHAGAFGAGRCQQGGA